MVSKTKFGHDFNHPTEYANDRSMAANKCMAEER